MKKILNTITLLSMFMLIGCGQQTVTTNPLPSSSVTAPSNDISLDENNPTLIIEDDLKININEKVHYLNLVKALDKVDGNITHLVEVDLPSGVTMQDGYLSFAANGDYIIQFKVTNSRNNTATGSIKIIVYTVETKDSTKPSILGVKENVRIKPSVMFYPLEGVSAYDDIDGDITKSLNATYQNLGDANDGISFEKEGNYKVVISAIDSSLNKQEIEINIEVNSEDLPTFVDITDSVVKEYGCDVQDSSEGPTSNSKTRKIVLTPNSDGSSKVYANFKIQFENNTDLKNKQLDFDVKIGDNVYNNKMSFVMRNSDGSNGSQLEYSISASKGKGYEITALDNGWYHMNIIFSELWSVTSYNTDYLRAVFSHSDWSKSATVYISNVRLDNYVSSDDGQGGVILPDEDENLYDYSDGMQNNYNTEISLDKEVNYDGVQSAKIVGSGVSSTTDTAGAQTHIQEVLTGKVLSFYVKFDGNTCRKNRVTLDIYKNSSDKFNGDTGINVTLEENLPNGITMSNPDANGWQKVEMDFDTLGYVNTEVYKIRFIIKSPDSGVTIPTCWIDKINVKDK